MKLFKLKYQRRWHKYLSLVVGLQLLIWSISGLYFSLFDIHDIHGEKLLTSPKPLEFAEPMAVEFADVLQQYPHAKQLTLKNLLGEPHFQFSTTDAQGNVSWHLLNGMTGKQRPKLTENEIRYIAISRFTGSADIGNLELLSKTAPSELAKRHLPVWQVQFDDWQLSTFYIHPLTGDIVTKRHHRWRLFDIFWRFHILDIEGENVANPLLTTMSLLALLMVFTGLLLTIRFIGARLNRGETR